MTKASKMRTLMLNYNVWNETWNRYSFIGLICNSLQQETIFRSRTTPSTPNSYCCTLVVHWINCTLPLGLLSLIRTVEEDFAILLSRSTPYIHLENKRPVTSASDWLWWPAKFLYRGQKCVFKARIYPCLS